MSTLFKKDFDAAQDSVYNRGHWKEVYRMKKLSIAGLLVTLMMTGCGIPEFSGDYAGEVTTQNVGGFMGTPGTLRVYLQISQQTDSGSSSDTSTLYGWVYQAQNLTGGSVAPIGTGQFYATVKDGNRLDYINLPRCQAYNTEVRLEGDKLTGKFNCNGNVSQQFEMNLTRQ